MRLHRAAKTAVAVALLVISCQSTFPAIRAIAARQASRQRPTIVVENTAASLTIDLAGGSFVDFHLKPNGLNPLVWGSNDDNPTPRAMGHFLCLDRWGPPSEAEAKIGMPFHGEASQVVWEPLQSPNAGDKNARAAMGATLPIAGLNIRREVQFSPNTACFVVTEQVTNTNKLGRIFNMVQHPTIGPPFLDEYAVVDSNAGSGFMQNSPLPNPEAIPIRWPVATEKGKRVDLRRLSINPNPNVTSFVISTDIGWVTACSPRKGLLIGYIWKTKDYPWFNAWRHAEKGKPVARGLEFGTTGLHQPFPALVAKKQIFGRSIYEYLDAGEIRTKRYFCFLLTIPQDFRGVARMDFDGDLILLHERGPGPGRTMKLEPKLKEFLK